MTLVSSSLSLTCRNSVRSQVAVISPEKKTLKDIQRVLLADSGLRHELGLMYCLLRE